MINKDTHLAIGKIHSPFALQGGVKVFCYADEQDHLRQLKGKSLLLLREQNILQLEVIRVEFKGDWPIFFFEGYTSPEISKEKLKGGELYAPRELVNPLEDDEFYLSDLMGLSITYEGKVIGSIVHYFEAAHIIVEAQMFSGKVQYFPFIAKYFAQPDFLAKTVALLSGDLLD